MNAISEPRLRLIIDWASKEGGINQYVLTRISDFGEKPPQVIRGDRKNLLDFVDVELGIVEARAH